MPRVAIPVTTLSRSGVAQGSSTPSDASAKHYLASNDGRTFLLITSSDGGSQTIAAKVATTVDGQGVSDKTITIAAGATVLAGPFPVGSYNQSAIAAAVTLTSDATAPANNDAVTIGTTTYVYKTALTEAFATATLTSDATAPANNDTVTIDGRLYTFKTTLTGTANEVLIGGSAANALSNLKKAINASGVPGVDYGANTLIHATVSAGTLTATTLLLTAITVGTGGNAYASTETSGHLSFAGATFSGGVDAIAYQVLIGGSAANALTNLKKAINASGSAGTDYATGTFAHSSVSAGTLTSTTLALAAATTGSSGNSIASTETSAHLSFGSVTLVDGYDEGAVFLDPSVSTNLAIRAFSLTF